MTYLRDQQYGDGSRLAARGRLQAYGRREWFSFLGGQTRCSAGQSIIDIGCGHGLFWAANAALLPDTLDVTLTAFSPIIIKTAMARLRAIGRWAEVQGVVGDAASLPFADGVFDVALCAHVLYHLPQPARGVAEIRRIVRPGGIALIATNGRANMAALWAIRHRVFGVDPGDPGAAVFGLESAEPMLMKAFKSVELIRFEDELRCTEQEPVVAYLLSMPPGDGACDTDVSRLRTEVAKVFDAGSGVLTVRKNVGIYRCTI